MYLLFHHRLLLVAASSSLLIKKGRYALIGILRENDSHDSLVVVDFKLLACY
jgi:hypothetical protein